MGTHYYSPRWVQSYRTFTSKKGTRTRNSLIWGLVGPPASDKLIPHCCLLEKRGVAKLVLTFFRYCFLTQFLGSSGALSILPALGSRG